MYPWKEDFHLMLKSDILIPVGLANWYFFDKGQRKVTQWITHSIF